MLINLGQSAAGIGLGMWAASTALMGAGLDNLADASVDAKKSLRLMQEHSQRADHPILITIPETGYLKGFTVEVIATR